MRKGHLQVFLLMCARVLPCIYSETFHFASEAVPASVLQGSWDRVWYLGLRGVARGLKGLQCPVSMFLVFMAGPRLRGFVLHHISILELLLHYRK